MRLLRGRHNPGISGEGCVATIGNFDGVHRGHQTIIKQLRRQAEKLQLPSLVTVFEPQPLEFFQPEAAPARLMSFREKLQALRDCGIDYVFCLKFDRQLSQLTASEFVDQVLVEHLNIKHLVIGDDFRFGGDREGDFELLKSAGGLHGFTVENTPTQMAKLETEESSQDDERISSTRVRSALQGGDFALAERLLGRRYSIAGRVQHGQKMGRSLGFPTANLGLFRLKTPLMGVYAVKVLRADGRCQDGVANIGSKPTVGQFAPNLEVHVLSNNESFYGEHVRVEFIERIRDEKKFESLEALKAQIQADVESASAILKETS